MFFHQTPLAGAYVIEPKRISDDRGYFARLLCRNELREQGLKVDYPQTNIGVSLKKHTLRGLHFQMAPHPEVKIVRCPRGSIFDVIVDLRPASSTYKQWFGIELNHSNAKAIYVPEGFAQGYMTLEDDTEIYYHTSEFFQAGSATGVRYNDPTFNIQWPAAPAVISKQDKEWPDFADRQTQIQF
jgi:dTDP-4-dehydrorhamnose 3,5-epimerase